MRARAERPGAARQPIRLRGGAGAGARGACQSARGEKTPRSGPRRPRRNYRRPRRPGPRLPPGRHSRTACPPGERAQPQRAGVESEVSAGGGLVSRLTPLRRLL